MSDETQFRPIVGRTWSLTWMESEKEGEVVILHDGFLVGRTEDCHLQLSEGLVSRHHATFRVTADECFLEDNQSTNGTYVNGQKISSESLQQGDVIQFDEIRFEVTQSDAKARPKGRDRRPTRPGAAPTETRLSERHASEQANHDDADDRPLPPPREIHTDEAQREQIRAERAARKASRASAPAAAPVVRSPEPPEDIAPEVRQEVRQDSSPAQPSLQDELAEEFAAIPEAGDDDEEEDDDDDILNPRAGPGSQNRAYLIVGVVAVLALAVGTLLLLPKNLIPSLDLANEDFVVNQSWATQPKNGSHFYGPIAGNFVGDNATEIAYADGFSLVLHNGHDGSTAGRINLPGTPISPPYAVTANDGSTGIFITTDGGRAQLIQGGGVVVWSTDLSPNVRGAYLPVPFDHTAGKLLLVPTQGQGIVAINRTTGTLVFDTTQVGESNITTNLLVENDIALVFGGGQRGSIFATNISTGIPQRYWEKRLPGGVTPIHLSRHNDNLVAMTAEGTVTALDRSTGETRWSSRIASGVLSNPVLIEDHLYVADLDGGVHKIDLETGITSDTFNFGIMIESPAVSHNGKLVLLDVEGQMQVVTQEGTIEVNHLIPDSNGHVNPPLIADVDNDGVHDLMTLSVNGVLARFRLDPL